MNPINDVLEPLIDQKIAAVFCESPGNSAGSILGDLEQTLAGTTR